MKSKIIVYVMFSLCIHTAMQASASAASSASPLHQQVLTKELAIKYGNAGPASIFAKIWGKTLLNDKEKKELMPVSLKRDPVCQSGTAYLTHEKIFNECAPGAGEELTVEIPAEEKAYLTVSPSKEGLAQPTTSYTTELTVPDATQTPFLDIHPMSSTTMKVLLYDLNDQNKPPQVVFDNTSNNK